jgi:hypothetical protein
MSKGLEKLVGWIYELRNDLDGWETYEIDTHHFGFDPEEGSDAFVLWMEWLRNNSINILNCVTERAARIGAADTERKSVDLDYRDDAKKECRFRLQRWCIALWIRFNQ